MRRFLFDAPQGSTGASGTTPVGLIPRSAIDRWCRSRFGEEEAAINGRRRFHYLSAAPRVSDPAGRCECAQERQNRYGGGPRMAFVARDRSMQAFRQETVTSIISVSHRRRL